MAGKKSTGKVKKSQKSKFMADYTPEQLRKRAQMDLKHAYEKHEAKKSMTGIKLKPKSKAKRPQIRKIQKEFQSLQKKAMDRVRDLRKAKLLGVSRAYQTALESKPKTTNPRRALFHIEDRTSYKEIRREVARMREFLNDESSTVEGAKFVAAELTLRGKYGGAFGRKWAAENNGHTFDPTRIDEEYARVSYKIFRYLEDMKGSYNLMYGEGAYDSESLMISIYDMVVQRDLHLDDVGRPTLDRAEAFYDTIIDMREKLEDVYNMRVDSVKAEREWGNTDTGVLNKDNLVVDLLENASSSQEFLKLLKGGK